MKSVKDIFKLDLTNSSAVKQFYKILNKYRISNKDKSEFFKQVKYIKSDEAYDNIVEYYAFPILEHDESNPDINTHNLGYKQGILSNIGWNSYEQGIGRFSYAFEVSYNTIDDGKLITKSIFFENNSDIKDKIIKINREDYLSNRIDAYVYIEQNKLIGATDIDSIKKINNLYKRILYLYNKYKENVTSKNITIVRIQDESCILITKIKKESDYYLLYGYVNGQSVGKYPIAIKSDKFDGPQNM